MSFPRYESYKDSGVEWLGEVPEHWGVTSLKRGFEVRLGKMLQSESSSPDDELLPYLRAANIHWSGVDVSDVKMMWFSSKERVQLTLLPNDLLISEGGDVGRSAMWNSEIDNCHFQNSVNRVRALAGNSSRYLYYWVSVIKDKGYIDVLCNKSTIAHFTAEKVQAVPVPFPSSSEQQAIATFLDRETAKIDALIAEQQRLIELLKEKRQAVISHAVTKGLNPDAPMKDSGIEWLGEVPEHWSTVKLFFLTHKIGDGLHGTPQYVEVSDFLFINGNNLSSGAILITESTRCISKEEYEKHRVILGDNSLLMSINGTIGSVAFYQGETVMLGKSAAYINCSNKLSRNFLYYFLQSTSVKTYFELEVTGTTIFNLSLESIRNLSVALPSLVEQSEIAVYLDNRISEFDSLLVETQRAITLLQERRTALISAAVTGKIDVRGLASPELPEEAAV